MKRTTILVSLLLIFFLNYFYIIFYYNNRGNGEFYVLNRDYIQLRKEHENLSHRFRVNNYIELEGQIIIDGNNDWASIATSNEWCSGNGTELDPYIIENIAFNGIFLTGCLIIKNSDVHFILRNCLIYNSEGSGDNHAGIKLINVKNGKILNNTVINNRCTGIYLGNSRDNTIAYNHFNNSAYSILLIYSNYNNISYNIVYKGIEPDWHYSITNQMRMFGSDNNIITKNVLKRGISLESCDNNIISYNNISQKYYYGIVMSGFNNTVIGNILNSCGLYLSKTDRYNSHTITKDNLVNGKPLYYYFNENKLNSNNFSNAGQVILINCNDCIISDLNIFNATIGIDLFGCVNNTIINNTVAFNNLIGIKLSNCHNNTIKRNQMFSNIYALYFYESSNNEIIGNILNENGDYSRYDGGGIYFYGCASNIAVRNYFEKNRWGIKIDEYSRDNLIFNNSFFENNAYDPLKRNKWDNGVLGNFWSYYIGEDLNDDGIGDIPYDIPPIGKSMDYFPLWDDGDNLGPQIIIHSPHIYQAFAEYAPFYNISIQDQSLLDAKWYTVNENPEKYYFNLNNASINQSIWDEIRPGIISIRFWANDTLGNIAFKEVAIIKYIGVVINKPSNDMAFSHTPPLFNINIYSYFNVNLSWYSLDNGITNYPFTGQGGMIAQEAWNLKEDGHVIIKFYVNDSKGYFTFNEVSILKDTVIPELIIHSPSNSQLFGLSTPFFNVDINDVNLQSKWYSLNNGQNITFTSETQFDNREWGKCGNGTVLIKFYAKDLSGNMNSNSILIRKDAIEPIIEIHEPTQNQVFKDNSPMYYISITEEDINISWYIIWTTYDKFYITNTIGKIDQNAWKKLDYRTHILRFYVKDKAGNIGVSEVLVIKYEENPIGAQILSNPSNLIIIFNFSALTIVITVLLLKKRKSTSIFSP